MFKELKNEAKISFVLYTKSPLSIRNQKSNPMNSALPDMQCMRSRYEGSDTVIIPGSSLKGVIRSRYERIVNLLDGKSCNVVDRNERCAEPKNIPISQKGKYVYDNMCPTCKLFGSTSIGARIRIVDAYPIDKVKMGERAGVGINRITGAAQRGALYDFEVVEEGKFLVEVYLKNYELYQLLLLLYVFKDLDDGYVALGGASTRGNGRVGVRELNISFRDYCKDTKCLRDINNETALIKNNQFTINYKWDSGFFGEANLEDVPLDELIKELSKDVDVRAKLKQDKK